MGSEDTTAGLCASCLHRRTVATARSTFYLCQRSLTDPRFPKYPVLPVLRCPGYDEMPRAAGSVETTKKGEPPQD